MMLVFTEWNLKLYVDYRIRRRYGRSAVKATPLILGTQKQNKNGGGGGGGEWEQKLNTCLLILVKAFQLWPYKYKVNLTKISLFKPSNH